MRILLSLLLLGGTVVGCATAVPSCSDLSPLHGTLIGIPKPEQLQADLHRIIVAHCNCDFTSKVREVIQLGLDGRGSWDGVTAACLGPVEVVEWSAGNANSMEIYLLQEGKPRREFYERHLVVANFVDGRWLFSWPAKLGHEVSLGPVSLLARAGYD